MDVLHITRKNRNNTADYGAGSYIYTINRIRVCERFVHVCTTVEFAMRARTGIKGIYYSLKVILPPILVAVFKSREVGRGHGNLLELKVDVNED